MSTENSVAERLLTDARRKTARQASPILARVALGVSILAMLVSPIGVFGWPAAWAVGLIAIILGAIAAQRSVAKTPAKIACALGFLAICIGTFLFTLMISR